MNLEATLLAELNAKPASGGQLIERLQAEGRAPPGAAVLVYGALRNLACRDAIRVVDTGPGEEVWGVPGAIGGKAKGPGFPPSFSLGAGELVVVEREVSEMTRGLRPHFFEELRRVVVADADRRVFNGEKLPRAVTVALEALGPHGSVRPFLKAVGKGKPVPLRLRGRMRWRWLVAPLVVAGVLLLARLLVVGAYTLPPESISMAPTLIPAVEGGDQLVLANLLAYRFGGEPHRGDIVVVDLGRPPLLVKRIMGLPGEVVSLRRGDLFVNGQRLVKDRALLDRVRIPLLGSKDLERTGDGWRTPREVPTGYRQPDGTLLDNRGPAQEVVLRARVRAGSRPASVLFELEDGRGPNHTVLLETEGPGSAAAAGLEVGKGGPLQLRTGRWTEVWITNADRTFRVEVDGQPVATPTPLKAEARFVKVAIRITGTVDLEGLEIARDAIHLASHPSEESVTLGPDQYFLLGDNSGQSRDSRAFGAVEGEQLVGRVFAVAWPPGRVRWIE